MAARLTVVLHLQRAQIVAGKYEPNDEECEYESEVDDDDENEEGYEDMDEDDESDVSDQVLYGIFFAALEIHNVVKPVSDFFCLFVGVSRVRSCERFSLLHRR
jgi:hypothetical protein